MEDITGRDLIAAGFEAGPELGKSLEHLRAKGLNGMPLVEGVKTNKPKPPLQMRQQPDLPELIVCLPGQSICSSLRL